MTKQLHIKTEFIFLFTVASLLLIGLLNTLGTSIFIGVGAGYIAFKTPLSIWYRHRPQTLHNND